MSRSTHERLARLACRLAESIAGTCSPEGVAVWRASNRDLKVRWDRLQRQQKLAAKACDRGWFQGQLALWERCQVQNAFSLPNEVLEVADRFFRAGYAWP